MAVGLLESAPDAIVCVDHTGHIALCNPRAEELFGYERGQLIGARLETLVPERMRRAHEHHREQYVAHPEARRMGEGYLDLCALRQDGTEVPVEIGLSPLPTSAGMLTMCIVRDVTERRRFEAELHRSRERLAEAQQLARLGSWEWDITANRVLWSDELFRIYGFEPGVFQPDYARFLAHVHPDDRDSVDARNRKAFADHQPFEDVKRMFKDDGTVILVRTQGEVVCDASGAPIRMLGVCENVTDKLQAQEAQSLLAAIVMSSTDAIYTRTLDGAITSWNPAAERLYGYTADEMVGASAAKLVPHDREDEDRELLERVMAGARIEDFETQCHRRDGELIDVSLSVSPVVRDGGLVGVSAIARDITERKRFEERLQWLADHDPLTGLFNRRRFEEELNAHAARAARYRASSALMLIDLDNLKYVNDTAGHSAGDVLIRSLARALSRRLRATDVLARLGGDEFAVLVPQATPRDAKALATELLEIIRNHATVVAGCPLRTTASIGLVLCPPAQDAGEALLAAADRAMYEAKDAGRDRLVVHAPHDGVAPTGARATWEHRINQALDGDLFELYSQPIVDLRTGATSRHELLLRMRDGDELIPPGAFLGVAERLGLIHRIDRWVVREAIALLAARPDLHLEVNLSGSSMDDSELPRLIRDDLDAAGVDPTHLVFEITETAAIANIDDARRFARVLGGLGCRCALDDFGAGFGSFTYLKHLPVDLLKIDGEFVRGPRSLADDLIIEAIVAVARGLGKQTVAEWIADSETAERVRDAGVDFGQGYFLGVPTPVSSLLAAR